MVDVTEKLKLLDLKKMSIEQKLQFIENDLDILESITKFYINIAMSYKTYYRNMLKEYYTEIGDIENFEKIKKW